MKTLFKAALIIGLTIILFSPSAGQNILIVNADFPFDDLPREKIASIFLGTSIRWSPQLKAFPIDQTKEDEKGKAYLSKIVKMYDWEYENWWVEVSLSGQALPISIVASDEDVVEFVRNTKGAIGYISASTPHEGVKILACDGNKEF